MTTSHLLAVALAVLGAVLFGLSAVRQHGAVHATTGSRGPRRLDLVALGRLVRQPSWLIGAVQGTLGGGAHVAALALAPITLVQPIGVLAVPVTVLAAAARAGGRPPARQGLGAALSVLGVVGLTLLLLQPSARAVVLPGWRLAAAVVLVTAGLTAVVAGTRSGPPRLRCAALAVASAVLFGLNAILLRTVGHLVESDELRAQLPLLLAAGLGIAVVLPVGLWAMQSAYLGGSPQVVLCCLTLVDPLAAVTGGSLLLHDGFTTSGPALAGALGCTALAVAGVLLLATARTTAADPPPA